MVHNLPKPIILVIVWYQYFKIFLARTKRGTKIVWKTQFTLSWDGGGRVVEGLALLVLRGFTRKVDRRIASFNNFVQTGS